MADLSYNHGVKVTESTATPSLLRVTNFGVTFINGTAPDADDAVFPVNHPTLVTSQTQAAALGAKGTLLDDVNTIFDEGGSSVIINRVEDDADEAKLQANLIGDAEERTGLYSVLRAKSLCGIQPRVIITAGKTGVWGEDGLLSVTLTANGSKLTEVPAVKFANGGNDPGKTLPTVVAVLGTGDKAGQVVDIEITAPGKRLTEPLTITFEGGGADAGKVLPKATANIGDLGNPFVSALATITPQIRARAYINGPNTSNAEAIRFRQMVNSDRILIIDPMGLKNVNGKPVEVSSAAVFAGVRARVVASDEGVSGSVSNKIIRSLDGVARAIQYPYDSNYLNEQHVSTIINERGGLRTWGSRLATDKLIWAFDSVRATADMINEALEDIYFQWADKKFTVANLKMMVEDGNAALRAFKSNDDILGGRVWLSKQNTPTLNAGGKVFLDVEYEPVGLMEQINITAHRNIFYYQLVLDEVKGAIDNGPLTLAQ
ncbi:phage tail protein [Rhizobium sp. CFBP 8762]|uniref:phage tail protein n=1 Tax=Rhizobium sp. CFBP 8762 TaxID=2775279 RepID=UPI001785DFCC|nr:phage tail protein [Rhizobium sp. CFBP 8762]MBD8556912.1 phage tail protein [Rhizobium sp. CFBP 8762]